VQVEDTGGMGAKPSARLPDGGHGLIGMHERVGLYGGTLTAGPTARGGWLLTAELPVRSGALVDGSVDA
jgi:signal transduction histidine kinase